MPQSLTPEQANTKICPFMRGRAGGPVKCRADVCACWGWVDPEQGELTHKDPEEITLDKGQSPPEGLGWRLWDKRTDTWRRKRVIGPRRGQCEAM